jgi:hypothetical protein
MLDLLHKPIRTNQIMKFYQTRSTLYAKTKYGCFYIDGLENMISNGASFWEINAIPSTAIAKWRPGKNW